jgi:hypothetical protein
MLHRRAVRPLVAGLLAIAAALLAGCGGGSTKAASNTVSAPASASASTTATTSGPEVNESGDIPDDQVFVAYQPPGQSFEVKIPEGWSRTEAAGAITFTDKLNSIRIEAGAAAAAPTVDTVKADVVPKIASSTTGYVAGKVSAVKRTSGPGVLVTYRASSAPDPVTKKVIQDDVERYLFWHNGTLVTLTLSGPHGADNVDPWKIVTDGLRWKA